MTRHLRRFRHGVLVGICVFASHAIAAPPSSWIAAWATAVQSGEAYPGNPMVTLDDQTVRERVRVSIGGPRLRICLSNQFGSAPLLVGSATVARPLDEAGVKPDSARDLTFGGRRSVAIPAGAPALSDAIDFPVGPGQDISVSLYLPRRAATATVHEVSLKRAVISPRGDWTHAEAIAGGLVSTFSIAVSAVLVPADSSRRLVVAFGDSITDGFASTVDADRSWPGSLARRLQSSRQPSDVAVVNEGIAGNRLLNDCLMVSLGCSGVSALARFDRDVLALPGVTHIILAEGVNDIAFPGARLGGNALGASSGAPAVDDLVGAYRQLIARAHARGLKVIGATLTPFEGVVGVDGFYSPIKETMRQAVNAWIRTGAAFDGIVDFDAVLRDPARPSRLLSRFASKDRLHPNDDGYQAMADAIDLELFR